MIWTCASALSTHSLELPQIALILIAKLLPGQAVKSEELVSTIYVCIVACYHTQMIGKGAIALCANQAVCRGEQYLTQKFADRDRF